MKKIKPFLFLSLMLVLWIPILQQAGGFFNEPKLSGAFTIPEKPLFSVDSFKTSYYQKHLEDYLNYHFGFRGLLIKAKNTISYSLFGEFNNPDLRKGKDGYIYSYGTIARTAGIVYEGKGKNELAIFKINFLKEAIEKHGGHFLAVIAPPKEMILPEFLPADLANINTQKSDYFDFVSGYKKYNIPFIDFCPYFKSIKDTCRYPLYTKTGFHWSTYGASIAQNVILTTVQKYFSEPLAAYSLKKVEWSDTARDMDADYEQPMNLLYSLNQRRYAYPKFEMKSSPGNVHRPKVIVIGDSYFNQIRCLNVMDHVFSEDSRFWYYFATSFPIAGYSGIPIKNVDVIKELESADLVILMCYTGNLSKFPFGVSDFYYNNKDHNIATIIGDNINNTPSWKKNIIAKGKAQAKDVSDDEWIAREADRIDLSKTVFQLKAFNNKFVCADGAHNNIIIADKPKASSWETFTLLSLENNNCAIYSYDQKFFSAELHSKNEINASKTYIAQWETFTIVRLNDGFVAFKASNGMYLSVDKESLQLFATATSIGKQELFKMIIQK